MFQHQLQLRASLSREHIQRLSLALETISLSRALEMKSSSLLAWLKVQEERCEATGLFLFRGDDGRCVVPPQHPDIRVIDNGWIVVASGDYFIYPQSDDDPMSQGKLGYLSRIIKTREGLLAAIVKCIHLHRGGFFVHRGRLKTISIARAVELINSDSGDMYTYDIRDPVDRQQIFRAIRDKVVSVERKGGRHLRFELQSFFKRGSVDPNEFRVWMLQVVAEEDEPLSDGKIADRLFEEQDVFLDRSTVRKYRVSFSIPSAPIRRKQAKGSLDPSRFD